MTALPLEPKRAKRRRLAKSHERVTIEEFHQKEYFVWMAPWDISPLTFDTAGKARRFRRKHQKEIEDNFDF